MTDVKTTDETLRSPIDGTEEVRLATTGANWKAPLSSIINTLVRTKLTADVTYYVATTGSDITGDGTVGNPWLTAQHAWDFLSTRVDGDGHLATIQLADGYYTDVNGFYGGMGAWVSLFPNPVGFAGVFFQGNPANPSAVVIEPGGPTNPNPSPVFDLTGGGPILPSIIVQFLTMQRPKGAAVFDLETVCKVYVQQVNFIGDPTPLGGEYFYLSGGAYVIFGGWLGGTINITDSNSYLAFVQGGRFEFGNEFNPTTTINFTNAVTFNNSFVTCQFGSYVFIRNFATTGPVPTGTKFNVSLGGHIDGGTLDTLPGSSPGAIGIGGTYNGLFGGPGTPSLVANLPPITQVPVGTSYFVTDALSPVNGSPVVGGGTVSCEVYSTSSNWIATGLPTRELLTANRTYYVATTGSDSNDGLTVGTPWLTLQHAVDFVSSSLDAADYNITIQLANGTYGGAQLHGYPPNCGPNYTIQGNVTDASLVTVNDSAVGWTVFDFAGASPANVTLRWMTLDTAAGASDISAITAANVFLNFAHINITRSGAGSGGEIFAHYNSHSNTVIGWSPQDGTSPINVSGNWADFIALDSAFCSVFTFGTITLTGTPNFSSAFIVFAGGTFSDCDLSGTTFSGAATGKKFILSNDGHISTPLGTGDLTALPGNVAGDFTSGSYDQIIATTGLFAVGGAVTGGFTLDPGNGGTVSTGTFTPAAINGNYQYYTNNGAHAFDVPAADSAIDVLVTNGASAGAITFSGTYKGGSHGDALTTNVGDSFFISVRRINGISNYIVKANQ